MLTVYSNETPTLAVSVTPNSIFTSTHSGGVVVLGGQSLGYALTDLVVDEEGNVLNLAYVLDPDTRKPLVISNKIVYGLLHTDEITDGTVLNTTNTQITFVTFDNDDDPIPVAVNQDVLVSYPKTEAPRDDRRVGADSFVLRHNVPLDNAISMSDLIDAEITAPVNGQLMVYEGGQWLNYSLTDSTSIDFTVDTGTNTVTAEVNEAADFAFTGAIDLSGTSVVRHAVRTENTATSPVTATIADQYILCNADAGDITVNLPNPATATGVLIYIKRVDGINANDVNIAAFAAEDIDGIAGPFVIDKGYDGIKLLCDGVNWWIVEA